MPCLPPCAALGGKADFDTIACPLAQPPSIARAGRRRFTRMLAAAGVAGLAPTPSLHAQGAWPSRPIRLVIPFPAGGATDIVGRVVAIKLSQALGQQVVVDNRPGAGGTIGADAVAKAAPDGHTLLLATSSTHSIGPLLNPKMPYDAIRDFTPIVNVAEAPSVLVVGASSPAADARALIAMLKGAPGRYNFGSSGIGTYPHLAAEMFKWRAGNLFVVHIPYRGTGLVIPDLVAGQIAFLMDSIVSAQPHIRDGKVRALAVSGARRSASLPNVPTFAEVGVQGMAISNWFGMFGPAGLPAEVVARVNREMNTLIASADVIDRFEKTGAEPRGGTAPAFAKLYTDEMQNWKAVIQRANIRVE